MKTVYLLHVDRVLAGGFETLAEAKAAAEAAINDSRVVVIDQHPIDSPKPVPLVGHRYDYEINDWVESK